MCKSGGETFKRNGPIIPTFKKNRRLYNLQKVSLGIENMFQMSFNILNPMKMAKNGQNHGNSRYVSPPDLHFFPSPCSLHWGKKIFGSANQAPAMGVFGKQKNLQPSKSFLRYRKYVSDVFQHSEPNKNGQKWAKSRKLQVCLPPRF